MMEFRINYFQILLCLISFPYTLNSSSHENAEENGLIGGVDNCREGGMISCTSGGVCPMHSFLNPEKYLFKSLQNGKPVRRRKRELITFLTTGLFYKYIVAWVIPQLALNEVCKNTGIDEAIINCFRMIFLKHRLSCKLPKPIRHSAKFASEVIDIALKHISDESKALIDKRYEILKKATEGLPKLDFDFGADPKLSLAKLQEKNLIKLDDGAIPAAFAQDGAKLRRQREEEEKANDGGIFGQMGRNIMENWKKLQGKSEDEILQDELDKLVPEIEKKLNEKEIEQIYWKELSNFQNGLEQKIQKQINELYREFRAKMEEEKPKIRRKAIKVWIEEERRNGGGDDQQQNNANPKGMEDRGKEEKQQQNDAHHHHPRSNTSLANFTFPPAARSKRSVLLAVSAGLVSFFTYNFIRRFAMRVAIKNVNIWQFVKRCFGSSLHKKQMACSVPQRFKLEQEFIQGVMRIILQDLVDAAINKIRLHYELFKGQFPMPMKNGQPVAEHEKLSNFLEHIFTGINIGEKYVEKMNAELTEEEKREVAMEKEGEDKPDH